MIVRHVHYHASDNPRDKALSSAVVLRDCSLRPATSHATRRACRTLMREQAIKWRQPSAAATLPQIH
jgi:hypothetical protein